MFYPFLSRGDRLDALPHLARLRRAFGAPLACLRHAFLLLSDRGKFLLTAAVVAVAVAADTVDDALAAHLAAFVVLVAVASVTAEAAVPAVAAAVAETAVLSM